MGVNKRMNHLENTGICRAFVKNVSWERVHLFLEIDVTFADGTNNNEPLTFYGVNKLGAARIKFDIVEHAKNSYKIKTNVTNNGQNRCIPTGSYTIFICQGEDILADCETDVSIVEFMADYSRQFLYAKQNKSYNINFYVGESNDVLPFRMRTVNLARTGLQFPKTARLARRIFKAFKDCILAKRANVRRIYKILCLVNKFKRRNTVLFLTEQSNEIKSNLKAVSEQMFKRGLNKDFKILFSARKWSDGPFSVMSWIKVLNKISKSSTIFIDDHVPMFDWLKLCDDTTLIQMWHAGAGFKSSGYSRWGQLGAPAPQSCHRQYSYGIAGSKHIAPFFSELWGINDEQVIATGMPRMDEFLDPLNRETLTKELYKQYPFCKGKKVILFAPTYRGNNSSTAFYPYELIDFKGLYELCADEYVVLFKMHPWVIENIVIPEEYSDKFIDVKDYPNINNLFYIVDLLITDYSSNIFEFSLMRKPMLFFAYDKIQYSFSRGFHRAYEASAPGKVVYTFDELLNAIKHKDFEFEKVEEYIKHHFDYIDSGASDRVIDWFLLGKMPEEITNAIRLKEEDMNAMMALDFNIASIEELTDSNIKTCEYDKAID